MNRSAVVSMIFCLSIILILGIAATGYSAEKSLSSSLGLAPYPSKGQSAQQQSIDESECYAWGKKQTGIDPSALASAPAQQSGPAVGGGERVRGAARGAAAGAVVGEIADDDAKKGASAGAAAGAIAGGRQARKNKAVQQEQAEQAKAGELQKFNKAFSACMEGRGYLIK